MFDESKMVLNVENKKQREILLKDTLKLLFVKNVLLERYSNEIPISLLRVQEFLDLDKSDNLLNLDVHCSNINLTYTEQKNLHKNLESKMQVCLNLLAPIMKTIKTKLPDLFIKKHDEENTQQFSQDFNEILALDLQRRELLTVLGDIHSEKLKLLKTAIDLKLAANVTDKTEVLYLEMTNYHKKANLLRDYMINCFVNSSEHTLKAINLVEQHIDKQVDEEDTNVERKP